MLLVNNHILITFFFLIIWYIFIPLYMCLGVQLIIDYRCILEELYIALLLYSQHCLAGWQCARPAYAPGPDSLDLKSNSKHGLASKNMVGIYHNV